MKKCEYCGKELESYHLQYCKDSDCEQKALKFYETRGKFEKLLGITNSIGVFGAMAGFIAMVFSPSVGKIILAIALIVLGIGVVAMPYAPENFYKKYKIKKTNFYCRILGVIILIGGGCFAVAYIVSV